MSYLPARLLHGLRVISRYQWDICEAGERPVESGGVVWERVAPGLCPVVYLVVARVASHLSGW